MKRILTTIIFIAFFTMMTLVSMKKNLIYLKGYRTNDFSTLIEYNGHNLKGLNGKQILIHKDFEKYIERIDQYAVNNEIHLIINQGFRPTKYVIKNSVVRPAKQSNHLAGFAIDFNIIYDGKKLHSSDLKKKNLKNTPKNVQNFISDIRNHKQLRWGGDFHREDPVHIDVPLNLREKNRWRQSKLDCNQDYLNRVPRWQFWK